jgi:hypothetical protein
MRQIVSISLGSSQRNWQVKISIADEEILVERIGTDGDFKKACHDIKQLDGKVNAICLGGMDRYLRVGNHRFPIRQIDQLASSIKKTPIFDGSTFKDIVEPEILRRLAKTRRVDFSGKKFLLVSGVDRYGMASTFPTLGIDSIIYGDLIFALGVPIPIRSLRMLNLLGKTLLPVMCKLPMSFLYPTGEKQTSNIPKGVKYFRKSDIIAGDFHFIKRYMPPDMTGKIIITNTITPSDVEILRKAGVHLLVCTTPDMLGRSFGTNVLEGILYVISGNFPGKSQIEIMDLLGWKPRIEVLN